MSKLLNELCTLHHISSFFFSQGYTNNTNLWSDGRISLQASLFTRN